VTKKASLFQRARWERSARGAPAGGPVGADQWPVVLPGTSPPTGTVPPVSRNNIFRLSFQAGSRGVDLLGLMPSAVGLPSRPCGRGEGPVPRAYHLDPGGGSITSLRPIYVPPPTTHRSAPAAGHHRSTHHDATNGAGTQDLRLGIYHPAVDPLGRPSSNHPQSPGKTFAGEARQLRRSPGGVQEVPSSPLKQGISRTIIASSASTELSEDDKVPLVTTVPDFPRSGRSLFFVADQFTGCPALRSPNRQTVEALPRTLDGELTTFPEAGLLQTRPGSTDRFGRGPGGGPRSRDLSSSEENRVST